MLAGILLSIPVFAPQMELRVGTQAPVQNIEFIEDSITDEEAKRILTQRFYKSEQINWVFAGAGVRNCTNTTEADSCYFNRWTRSLMRRAEGERQRSEGRVSSLMIKLLNS